jgi:DNA anti-recombination protein RmuC
VGLLDKAKDAAKKAQETASKGISEAKDKGQEYTLKRRQNALAEELGQIVFRQREGEAGLDAEIDRLVGEMRALKAEIDALDEE